MSIWSENCELQKFKELNQDINTDILIIGGGLCGILCAYMLDKQGADYVLLEADRISSKTTMNTTAKITSQHGLIYSRLFEEFGSDFAKSYYLANEEAIKEYDELCENIDCDYKKSPSYIYSVGEDKRIKKEYETLKSLGIKSFYEKRSELPFPISCALGFENQASFNPIKFVSQIAKNLNIYENARVVEMIGNTAYTERHKINAKRVIVATHFPFINKHGLYFLKMYQERSYVLAIDGVRELSGMYLDDSPGGLSFRSYKNTLLLGGGTHRTGKAGCGWANLKEAAHKLYPDCKAKYKWATQDCITLDGVPYIGKYSKFSDNLYVATGFNKWGMTSSMVGARLLCDMLVGNKNEYQKIFSPQRSIFRKQLAINSVEALRGWISFGKKRCPHLGCALNYNKYEHSWDCSCHGSRFDKDGRLLNNPANSDM